MKTIIEMARECSADGIPTPFSIEEIERFATLVKAAHKIGAKP